MHEEGLYRQLLDEILAKRDIHSLDQYENVLKERYPEGAKIAGEIAREWRAVYARRPAMMDELRKGGF